MELVEVIGDERGEVSRRSRGRALVNDDAGEMKRLVVDGKSEI